MAGVRWSAAPAFLLNGTQQLNPPPPPCRVAPLCATPQDIWNKPIHLETVFYTNYDANNLTTHNITFRNSTLWDLANAYIERASEVQHM